MLRAFRLPSSSLVTSRPKLFFRFKSNDQIIEKLESSSCYYKVLGVNEDASQLEIEDAYVDLKSIFDHSKESTFTERRCVQKIDNAYNVLSNIEHRSMYDLKLRSGFVPTAEDTLKSLQQVQSDTGYNRLLMYLQRPKPQNRPLYEGPFERRRQYIAKVGKWYLISMIVVYIAYLKSVFPEKLRTWGDWLNFPKWYFLRRREIVKHHKEYLRIYHNNASRDIGDYLTNFPWIF